MPQKERYEYFFMENWIFKRVGAKAYIVFISFTSQGIKCNKRSQNWLICLYI